uniref:Uncharacterized protein n=1 Tax=Plectus sambesii TaxID=2011161 RepID=A0A914UIW3_9BILA
MKPFFIFPTIIVLLVLTAVTNASDAIYNDDESSSTSKESHEETREKRQIFDSVRRTGRPLAGVLNDFDKINDQPPVESSSIPPAKPGERRGRSVLADDDNEDSQEFIESVETEEEQRRSERAVDKLSIRPRTTTRRPRPHRPRPRPRSRPVGTRRERSVSEESEEVELQKELATAENNNTSTRDYPTERSPEIETRARRSAGRLCKRAVNCPLRKGGYARASQQPAPTYYARNFHQPQQPSYMPNYANYRRGRRLAEHPNSFEVSNTIGE